MDKKKLPLGVFDSGIGGLSVVKQLQKVLPHEDIVYIGDTKRNPYGVRSDEEIIRFSIEMAQWLEKQGIKLGIIACNTITCVSYDALEKEQRYPLVGMSRGLQMAAEKSKNRKVAVLATPATIHSHSHQQCSAALYPDLQIAEVSCPPLASLIEMGVKGEELDKAIYDGVQMAMENGVDAAILGCTHYPFVRAKMEELAPSIQWIDPGLETSELAEQLLKEKDWLNPSTGLGTARIYFTDHVERGAKAAARMLRPGSYTVEKACL